MCLATLSAVGQYYYIEALVGGSSGDKCGGGEAFHNLISTLLSLSKPVSLGCDLPNCFLAICPSSLDETGRLERGL